jgi:hypothetical protein
MSTIITVGAAALAIGGMATAASPASASTVPAIYMAAGQVYHWTMPSVRPGTIYLGCPASACYGFKGMRYSHWSNYSAYGRGTVIVAKGSGDLNAPKYPASAAITDVKTHHGTRYFASMKIRYSGHTVVLHMTRSGYWR